MRRVLYKNSHVDKGGVATELFECLSRLEAMDPDRHVVRSTEELTTVSGELQRGDPLSVSSLKTTKTLTSLEFPHLERMREKER